MKFSHISRACSVISLEQYKQPIMTNMVQIRANDRKLVRRMTVPHTKTITYLTSCILVVLLTVTQTSQQQQQQQQPSNQDLSIYLKSSPFTVDLYHKFGSGEEQQFTLRGSILVRPKTEYRPAQVSWVGQQSKLTAENLKALKEASQNDDFYYLRSTVRAKKDSDKESTKTTQTVIKACSLYNSKLFDYLILNLSPFGDFLGLNIYTEDPNCSNPDPELAPEETSLKTTLTVDLGALGPQPDTATYIRRIEEERQNKLKEGKEDNRSFFAKYWIYIVPAVVILMMFSGPEQGSR